MTRYTFNMGTNHTKTNILEEYNEQKNAENSAQQSLEKSSTKKKQSNLKIHRFNYIGKKDIPETKSNFHPSDEKISIENRQKRDSFSYQGPNDYDGQYTGLNEMEIPSKYRKRLQVAPFQSPNQRNIQGVGGFDPYLFKKSINVYYGEWKKGQPHGYGKLFNPDRDYYYEGYFQSGLPSCSGVFLSKDIEYRGAIKFGRAQGQGVYMEGKKKNIKGVFHNNLPFKNCVEKGHNYTFQGDYSEKGEWKQGILAFNSDTCNYKGSFEDGLMHGKGLLQTPYYKYEGEFQKGKKNGIGKIEWKVGYQYEGQFKDDQITGKGVLTDLSSEKIIYIGEFANGKASGEGSASLSWGKIKNISAKFQQGVAVSLL